MIENVINFPAEPFMESAFYKAHTAVRHAAEAVNDALDVNDFEALAVAVAELQEASKALLAMDIPDAA